MDGTVLQFTAEGEADMFLVMDLHPIDAHILDTSIRVFGDHTRGTEIWSAVTARSPNGSGELQKAELRVSADDIEYWTIGNLDGLYARSRALAQAISNSSE